MEAKRRALDGIAARQRAAEEKRQKEAQRLQEGPSTSQPAETVWFREITLIR
jgi:hypothetical protein